MSVFVVFLGAFSQLRKATIGLVMSVRMEQLGWIKVVI